MRQTVRIIVFWLVCALPAQAGVRGRLLEQVPGSEPRQPPPPDRTRPPIRPETTIRGSVRLAASGYGEQRIEVRLEGLGSQRYASAFTDGSGSFDFGRIALDPSQTYYIAVDVTGFRPYRERLDRLTGTNLSTPIRIMLDRASPTETVQLPGGPLTVDVRQLAVPEEAVEEYGKAVREAEDGNRDRSIELLLGVLAMAPDYAEAHNYLGSLYMDRGQPDNARSAFEKARDTSPAWAVPRVNLGVLEYQQGQALENDGDSEGARRRYLEAITILEDAIRVDPVSPSAHYRLGMVLYEVSEYSRSESMLMRALDLYPDLDDAYLLLVNVRTRQGRYAAALDAADRYIERNPDSAQIEALLRVRSQLQSRLDNP